MENQRVTELHAVANSMRKHRLDWNSYLMEPSTVIPELNAEAGELAQIFDKLQGFNCVTDSFQTTFNEVFITYITGHPENANSALQVFNALSMLLREISLKSELIERYGEYYSNLHNEAEELEISNMKKQA